MRALSAYITTLILTSSSFALAAPAVEVEEGGIADIAPAHDASTGGLPQFNPESFASQTFWLAITFLILYVFFSKKTLPEISSVIENRRNHIQSDLETAEKLTAEAEEVQQAYEDSLKSAREEATRIIQGTEQSMKDDAAREAETFRKHAEQEIKTAEMRIENAKQEAMDDMNNVAAEAASMAVAKIIEQDLDATQAKTVIENLHQNKARAA